jgi:hypothetical protein
MALPQPAARPLLRIALEYELIAGRPRRHRRCNQRSMFTKSARAKTNATTISFPMCCHSVAVVRRTERDQQRILDMRSISAARITLSFAFTILLATSLRRTSTRAISSRPYSYRLGSQLYRKPYTSAQCVRAAGDSSTLTMIK